MTDQTSLLDHMDWRPESRADSVRLRSLPPARDWRYEVIERRVHELELEARALVRSIPWREVGEADRWTRGWHRWGFRPQLLRYIASVMLVVRAPHLTNEKRLRLLDAFDDCFAWEPAHLEAPYDAPERDRGSNRFNRAVRELARVGRVNLAEIGRRDGWRCVLCGLPALRRAPRWLRTHPLGATIDHDIPISRGGPDTYANARLAHGWCNTVRHDDSDDRRFARRHRAELADQVIGAVLEWERGYGGDHLAAMRRWLPLEEGRERRGRVDGLALAGKLRRSIAAEEARLATAATAQWDRPPWYLDLLRQAAIQRAERRGFCVTCLLQSSWLSQPHFVRHRRPDIHEAPQAY
jgi:hypothetical protein